MSWTKNFKWYSHIEVRWKIKQLFLTMHRTSTCQIIGYQWSYIKKTWLFYLRQGILYFAPVILGNVEKTRRNYNCCIREVRIPVNFLQPDCAIFFIEKNKCTNVKRFWKLCIFIKLYLFYLHCSQFIIFIHYSFHVFQ